MKLTITEVPQPKPPRMVTVEMTEAEALEIVVDLNKRLAYKLYQGLHLDTRTFINSLAALGLTGYTARSKFPELG